MATDPVARTWAWLDENDKISFIGSRKNVTHWAAGLTSGLVALLASLRAAEAERDDYRRALMEIEKFTDVADRRTQLSVACHIAAGALAKWRETK